MVRVCIAGVTGWVGRALVPAIAGTQDLVLTGAVARREAGRRLADVLAPQWLPPSVRDTVIRGTVSEALQAGADVLIDYTAPDIVKANALCAIACGVHVVIGTSGLAEPDFVEIDVAATQRRVGVLAGANFAISAIILEHVATLAARFMPSWEIIDYAASAKPDAPSGTARHLAHRLAEVGRAEIEVPVDMTLGSPSARGLSLDGMQVHSVRLPGHIIGVEVLFGRASERLSFRYDAGAEAEPYIGGTLASVRRVGSFVGLRRDLTEVLRLE